MSLLPIGPVWAQSTVWDRAWCWVRLVGFLYVAGCVLFLSYQWHALTEPLPEFGVPLLVGRPQSEVDALLKSEGLVAHVDEQRFDGVGTGVVMYQSLTPGMRIRQGRSIYLVVCQGPLHVTVPDLRQAPSYQAIQTLTQLGLRPLFSSTAHSSTIPMDYVIEQVPGVGYRAEVGSSVALVVSDGPTNADAAGYGAVDYGDDTPPSSKHGGSSTSSKPGGDKHSPPDDHSGPVDGSYPPADANSASPKDDSHSPTGPVPVPDIKTDGSDLPPAPDVNAFPDPSATFGGDSHGSPNPHSSPRTEHHSTVRLAPTTPGEGKVMPLHRSNPADGPPEPLPVPPAPLVVAPAPDPYPAR